MLAVIAAMKDGATDAAVDQFEAGMPNPADVPADMMADYLQQLFKIADSNDDGVLSPVEFAELLSRSGFNFPAHVIVSLVKAADVNEDGVIEYEEFVPAMLGLMEAANEADLVPDVAEGVPMWDEVPDEMLERYLTKLFAIGDSNQDGVLQPKEFLELLTRAGLRFPPELVLKLFLEADINHDGVIEYDEFMPAMLAVIAAMKEGGARAVPPSVPDSFPAPSAPVMEPDLEAQARDFLLNGMSREKLERTILRSFLFADTNNSGALDESEFRACIQDLGLGLSPVHIAELMAAVDKNADGVIAYDEWVPLAFELMVQIVKQSMQSGVAPAAAAPAPAAQEVGSSWTSIAKAYHEPTAVNSPVVRPQVPSSGPTTELEGRVHALQSRRLLRGWVKDLFSRLDSDLDGRLSQSELAAETGVELARQMILVMDKNRDGKLSQVEVRDYFDDEAAKMLANSGMPEWQYLQGIVDQLGITA
jgi:Ca2+-binding EF-hand superfamily protein